MGRKYGWHSGKLSCRELDVDQTLSLGSLNFGSVEMDTILLNGRMATGTSVGGTSLALGATYAYGEAIELRYNITNWTGIGSSFKALYLRSEADLGGSYGLRCAEFYAVMDTSTTTGLSSLQNVYAEMLVKSSASSRTLTNGHCIEANISVENQTGTLTLTNNIYCLYAKAQTGTGINDYTKVNGIKIAGRDDGTARVFGNALDISDPEATVCTWTKGINITTSCTTGISIATGTFTTAIDIGGTMTRGIRLGTHNWGDGVAGISVSDTDPLFQIAGKISGANVSAGMYASSYTQLACKYAQTNDVSLAASWNELYITGGTLVMTGSSNYYSVWGHVEVAGTITTSTGNLCALSGSLIIPATLTNNGNICGCKVDAILNTGYTNSGIVAAFAIGTHNDPGQDDWQYGLYIPADTVTTGISIGTCTHEIVMRGTVSNEKTIIASGSAADDAAIVAAVGADSTIADGSLYMQVIDGAGALYIKKNDVWTAYTNP